MGLIEYTISQTGSLPFKICTIGEIQIQKSKIHYFNVDCGYTKGANRFAIGYGKKRAGIFLVEEFVIKLPSSNGFNLSITTNFFKMKKIILYSTIFLLFFSCETIEG